MLIAAAPRLAMAQKSSIDIHAGTPLFVQLGKPVPMKMGEPLNCHLRYPVYERNKLVIPAGSLVRGRVVALKPDSSRRIHSRLWGDFTPFHIPVVRFNRLTLPDGMVKKIATGNVTGGVPVLHLSTPTAKTQHSIFSRLIAGMKNQVKQSISFVTAPGIKDRLVQMLYRQLPYHPESIAAKTAWTASLTQPVDLKPYRQSTHAKAEIAAVSPGQSHPALPSAAKTAPNGNSPLKLRAYLERTISSATEKPGNTFQALVVQPAFNAHRTLVVPEGSILVGTIVRATPARSFGRAGQLRFDFRKLKPPGGGPARQMEGTLAGVDAARSQQLQIDSEGGVRPKVKDRVIVPAVMTALAGRALNDDGVAQANAAVASNGFGIVGRVVGIAAGSRELAAGIGFYGAGLSFAEHWLVPGQNVVFRKGTRIEVTAIPSRHPLPMGGPQSNPSEKR
jgi:hypothetical protein